MDSNAIVWTALGASAALIAAAVALMLFWMNLGARMADIKSRAESAATLAVAAEGKAQLLASEFANHRERVGHDLGRMDAMIVAASSGIIEAEKRLTSAIDSMGKRFEDMSDRLDKLLFDRIK